MNIRSVRIVEGAVLLVLLYLQGLAQLHLLVFHTYQLYRDSFAYCKLIMSALKHALLQTIESHGACRLCHCLIHQDWDGQYTYGTNLSDSRSQQV